jgi:hypothetical protein
VRLNQIYMNRDKLCWLNNAEVFLSCVRGASNFSFGIRS